MLKNIHYGHRFLKIFSAVSLDINLKQYCEKSYENITRLDPNCFTDADSLASGGVLCILFNNISGLVCASLLKSLVGILFLTLKISHIGIIGIS